jgi:hypothetical protein
VRLAIITDRLEAMADPSRIFHFKDKEDQLILTTFLLFMGFTDIN